MSREAFLARVRAAAEAGRAYRVTTRTLPDDVGYVGPRGDLCDAFATEATAVGGEVYLVDDLTAAAERLSQLCMEIAARSALCWQHNLLDRVGVRPLLDRVQIDYIDHTTLAALPADEQRARILAAHVGITSCEYAIAETGSLLMLSRPGRERVASLLPAVSISIIERAQLLPDLYDAFQRLGAAALPSNAVFITGPSKTGDMELELTTGVHGPKRWIVLVVRSSATIMA
jgi:L-lactate utilization protein LutC